MSRRMSAAVRAVKSAANTIEKLRNNGVQFSKTQAQTLSDNAWTIETLLQDAETTKH